jgi:hypothetical protein
MIEERQSGNREAVLKLEDLIQKRKTVVLIKYGDMDKSEP